VLKRPMSGTSSQYDATPPSHYDAPSSHYTPAYTPRSPEPPEALHAEEEGKGVAKKVPRMHETVESVDSYPVVETDLADDVEDVVLVFDLEFDDIYQQEAEFADDVATHIIHALGGGDTAVIDPDWVKITKLKRGSIRVYVRFGSGSSCGGRGGGITAAEALVRLHQQAVSPDSKIKSGPLGGRLKGIEVNSAALKHMSRPDSTYTPETTPNNTARPTSAYTPEITPNIATPRTGGSATPKPKPEPSPRGETARMSPAAADSMRARTGSQRSTADSRGSSGGRTGLASQSSLMNLFFGPCAFPLSYPYLSLPPSLPPSLSLSLSHTHTHMHQ
jgi:hypothetical protein